MVKIAKRLREGERKRLQKRMDEARVQGGLSASLFLEWEMNALTHADCFFFYGGRLCPKGVLSVFFPDEGHAELTVARFAEKTGILSELFFRALKECNRVGVSDIHTVVDPSLGFSLEEAEGITFSYERSEYMLRIALDELVKKHTGLPEDTVLTKEETEDGDGTVRYGLVRDRKVITECLIYPMPGTNEAYLYGLKTETAFRRQGLATRLMGEIAGDLTGQGIHKMRLQVSSENREAETLYRKLGFETEEERKYYRTKEQPDGRTGKLPERME